MARIRILLYVTPKFKWKYLTNWLISLWTRSKYSHSSVWTADNNRTFSSYRFPTYEDDVNGYEDAIGYGGTCWTSTTRGDANGTVSRPASGVLDHPEHWVYFEIEIKNETSYASMLAYMKFEVDNNKGYSRWDLLKFLSPIHFPDNKRNICSEFVNNALYYAGIFDKGGIVSPKKLAKKLSEAGYITKALI